MGSLAQMMPVTPGSEQLRRRRLAGFERVQRVHHPVVAELDAQCAPAMRTAAACLRCDGHVVARPEQDADALVAELHAGARTPAPSTSRRRTRPSANPRPSIGGVHQHGRQLQLDEPRRSGRGSRRPARRRRPRRSRPRPAGAAAARRSRTRRCRRRSGCRAPGVYPFCASPPPIASASAGKIGFCSSGITRPTSRARSPRSLVGRS